VRTYNLTTARNPDNFKVMGQRWRSNGFFLFAWYSVVLLSLEPGL